MEIVLERFLNNESVQQNYRNMNGASQVKSNRITEAGYIIIILIINDVFLKTKHGR
jgi:hypothetical protein